MLVVVFASYHLLNAQVEIIILSGPIKALVVCSKTLAELFLHIQDDCLKRPLANFLRLNEVEPKRTIQP